MEKTTLLQTIRRQAFDDGARFIVEHGIMLTHDEADEIGDVGFDWLKNRLGLTVTTDDEGVYFLSKR